MGWPPASAMRGGPDQQGGRPPPGPAPGEPARVNDTASHLEALRAVLGERGLLAAPDDLSSYETGALYDRGRAAFVARPATTAEASAVMAYCVRHGLRLVPQGGNTGL